MSGGPPSCVAIVGGGILGVAIAAELCLCGVEKVRVFDRSPDAQTVLPSKVRDLLASYGASGMFGESCNIESVIDTAMAHCEISSSLSDAVDGANLVVEAIYENLDAKVALFEELDKLCNPDTILTTNTLTLPLAKVAALVQDKTRVVGLRFLHPVVFIPFVELTCDTTAMDNEKAMNQVGGYMAALGKVSFLYSDVVASRIRALKEAGTWNAVTQAEIRAEMRLKGLLRFRLSHEECRRHQARESRLRFIAGVSTTEVVGVEARAEAAATQEEIDDCVICWDAKPNAVILSCGHRAFCLPCSQRLNLDAAPCPLCRTRMRGVFELV